MALVHAAALIVAAASAVPFQRVATEAGGTPDAISALLQDSAGFLWIGARDGLFRYDGSSLQAFRHDPANARSLPDGGVRTIFEDAEGSLWVGTGGGGVARLDRASWSFDRFGHDPSRADSLSHDVVHAVAEDRAGDLWVGTERGLNRLQRRTGSVARLLPDDAVSVLFCDGRGALWVGTVRSGLQVMDRASGTFRAFRHDARDPASLPGDMVTAVAEDGAGNLWIGTERGVARVSPARALERVAGFDAMVTSIAAAPDAIWVGTASAGAWRIDAGTAVVRRAHPVEDGPQQITALLVDRARSIWIGTWGKGLYRATAPALLLGEAMVETPAGAGDEAATAVAPARDGGAWVGTRSGALVHVHPDRTAMVLRRFGGETVQAIAEAAGAVWVGTTAGLRRVDHAGRGGVLLVSEAVAAVASDGRGHLWVASEGGLQRIDPVARAQGRAPRRFRRDPADAALKARDSVTALLADSRGTVWAALRSGALDAVDGATGRLQRRTNLGHEITSLAEDARGRLWLGTAGGGFARIDQAADGEPRFERFAAADGLVDDFVVSIAGDAAGTLWIATRAGLSRFDPETRAFATLLAADGLPPAGFERGAAARAGSFVLFGSLRRVVAVPASTPFARSPPSPLAIAGVRTPAGEQGGPFSATRIDVRGSEWISLQLAVLDFLPADAHAYAYRLGKTSPWIDLGRRGEITLAGLAPGTWDLWVRGRDARGVWTEMSAPALHVIPPFWRRPWFGALITVFAAAAAIALQRRRVSRLASAYERLGLLTRRLEAAKEEERGHIARELHDELGPNLTAVILNLQLLANLPDPEKARRRIQDSTDIVDRMVQRIRDLSLDLRPPLLDEMGLSAALRGYLDAQAGRTGLAIEMVGGGDVPAISPEVAITAFRVTQEAVTNAIRHAAGRHVRVDVRRERSDLRICIEDDGRGFDVEAAMAGPLSKALGLLGMLERVRLLGGEVHIHSQSGAGTRVDLHLPLEVTP